MTKRRTTCREVETEETSASVPAESHPHWHCSLGFSWLCAGAAPSDTTGSTSKSATYFGGRIIRKFSNPGAPSGVVWSGDVRGTSHPAADMMHDFKEEMKVGDNKRAGQGSAFIQSKRVLSRTTCKERNFTCNPAGSRLELPACHGNISQALEP